MAFTVAILVGGNSPCWAQTWSIDASLSSVNLFGNTTADDFDIPLSDADLQADTDFQTPFVDLNGDPFDIGENISAEALAGNVRASAASVVKATQGATLSIEWRSATDLEMRGDTTYLGTATTTLDSTITAQLSGLTPGLLYRVLYDWNVSAIAVEDHENLIEDPEFARSSMSFDFGGTPVGPIAANAGASQGFIDADLQAGSGMFFLIGAATPVDLSVTLSARADARFTNDPIFGSPPEDGAGSEGFGSLRFRTEVVIPEPSSALLILFGVCAFALRRTRCSH